MSFLISEFICNLVSGINKIVLGELKNVMKNKAGFKSHCIYQN